MPERSKHTIGLVPLRSVVYVQLDVFHLITVACPRRRSGAASSALSTSACDAPGSSGGGGGGAAPCAHMMDPSARTPIMVVSVRFILYSLVKRRVGRRPTAG